MKILVTGSAGFIGANLVLRLLEGKEPSTIVGVDILTVAEAIASDRGINALGGFIIWLCGQTSYTPGRCPA